MAKILLIRHGETDYVGDKLAGRLEAGLNERGRKQAQHLAAVLAGLSIRAVYSSPMQRALGTARPLAEALNLPVEICPSLTQVDFGEWQGLSFDELKQREDWKAFNANPGAVDCPGGERSQAVRQRVVLGLERIASEYDQGELVACFTHGSIIRHAVAYYIGLPLCNVNRMVVYPASVTTLQLNGVKARMLHMNQEFPPSLE